MLHDSKARAEDVGIKSSPVLDGPCLVRMGLFVDGEMVVIISWSMMDELQDSELFELQRVLEVASARLDAAETEIGWALILVWPGK